MPATTIATVAMRGSYDVEHNLKQHLAYIDEAADAGADLVVFPEISLQGYPVIHEKLQTPRVLAESFASAELVPDGPSVMQIIAKAQERQIHVIFGLTEAGARPGVVYNTAVLVGPDGYIGKYRKVHLGLSEQIVWRQGHDWPVFETPFGKIGMLICYDKAWPESCRELTLRGADILVMPTAWGFGNDPQPDPETNVNCNHYRLYDQVRAVENQRWFVSSNFCGEIEGAAFLGLSQIIDPLGRIVATSGMSESGLALATIDVQGGIAAALAHGQGARLIRDRRPETYSAMQGELATAIDG
jgi:predicted amidohydrolase